MSTSVHPRALVVIVALGVTACAIEAGDDDLRIEELAEHDESIADEPSLVARSNEHQTDPLPSPEELGVPSESIEQLYEAGATDEEVSQAWLDAQQRSADPSCGDLSPLAPAGPPLDPSADLTAEGRTALAFPCFDGACPGLGDYSPWSGWSETGNCCNGFQKEQKRTRTGVCCGFSNACNPCSTWIDTDYRCVYSGECGG